MCACAYVFTYIGVCVLVGVGAHVYVYVHVCVCARVRVYTYMCMHACVCICVWNIQLCVTHCTLPLHSYTCTYCNCFIILCIADKTSPFVVPNDDDEARPTVPSK